MTALARLGGLYAALVLSLRALVVIATARIPLLPGWVVPVPAVLLTIALLAAAALAARAAVAAAGSRVARRPYVLLAIAWREVAP